MAGQWRGPFSTTEVPVSVSGPVLIDKNPYRHWLEYSGKTDPDESEGCGAPPAPSRAPILIGLEVDPEMARSSPEEQQELIRRDMELSPLLGLIPRFFLSFGVERLVGKPLYATAIANVADLNKQEDEVTEDLRLRPFRVVMVGAPLPNGVVTADPGEDAPLPASVLPDPFPDRVVAVVDTDIPFAHARFRKTVGATRIAYFWDMDADVRPLPPTSVPVGRELYRTDIDAYLARLASGEFGEEGLYDAFRAESYSDLSRVRRPSIAAHGAHILDMAAGADYLAGSVQENVAILAVQLPRWVLAETHGALMFPYVHLAIERIRERVMAMTALWRETDPDVTEPEIHVNLSLGGVAGRHDAFSQFERYLDGLAQQPEIAAVNVAAGNFLGQNLHARLDKTAVEAGADIDWRIQPDDGTASFLQTWLPEGADPTHLEYQVAPPGGHPVLTLNGTSGDIVPGKYYELCDGCEVLARLYVETDAWPLPDGNTLENPRTELTLAVRHNKAFHDCHGYSGGRPDLAGAWKLHLIAAPELLQSGEEVMLWVERDDALRQTNTGARQSYLESTDCCVIHNDGTISDIGTGENTNVIAAFRKSDGKISDYSGEGYLFQTNSQQRHSFPTVAAVADDSPVRHGLLGAGYFSGSAQRLSGTSVATAVVTRHTAGLSGLLRPGHPVHDSLKDQALIDEASGSGLVPTPPPTKCGSGRLIRLNPPRP